MTLRRSYFIRCKNAETREFQYRFLKRWCTFLEEHVMESKEHWNSQRQSIHKLEMVLEPIVVRGFPGIRIQVGYRYAVRAPSSQRD